MEKVSAVNLSVFMDTSASSHCLLHSKFKSIVTIHKVTYVDGSNRRSDAMFTTLWDKMRTIYPESRSYQKLYLVNMFYPRISINIFLLKYF